MAYLNAFFQFAMLIEEKLWFHIIFIYFIKPIKMATKYFNY